MKIPTKKLTNGFEMPVYGLGTWEMGGRMEVDTSNDDNADIEGIRYAIDQGVTHIDTAESYAEGHSEEILGEAIKGYDREKLFLVSKVNKKHLRYDDLINSAKASLKRIGTDYLDLYLIHSPSVEISIEESMQAMNELVSMGLVKNIGVSNFTVERMIEAQKHSKAKIVANQLQLSLKVRESEKAGLVKYCAENDVMFIAWRPIEKGVLTEAGIEVLDEMCKKYGKTPSQIALNWLISQPNVVTLSKTRNKAHLNENLGAVGWQMSAEDVEVLRKEFPDQLDISPAVPLR